jgi:amino acid transporter
MDALTAPSPTGPEAPPPESTSLARNQVSALQVAIVSIAATGPAANIALVVPVMAGFAGKALVFAFLLTLVVAAMLTNTFAEFAKRLPSAGSLLAWNEAALGSNVGFVFGWLFVGGYLVVTGTGFAAFGGFAHDYFDTSLGLNVPWWIFTAAAIAYIVALAWRGLAQTVGSALALLGLELGVMLLLALSLLVTGHIHFESAPLDPGSSPAGWSGIGLALTFGVACIVGYEEAATLGEEAQDARRSVGRGLWIAAIFMPLFLLVVSYALITSYRPFSGFTKDPLAAQTLATDMWHSLGGIVTVVIIFSALAFAQTAFNAGARVVYSLGTVGLLPAPFARTHTRFKTPSAAIVLFAIVSATPAVILAAIVGPLSVYSYFGFMVGVSFLVIYALTSLGLIRHILRHHRSEFSPFKHVVLPLGATAGVLYPLYKSVVPLPAAPYPALLLVVIGWITLGTLLLVYIRKSHLANVGDVTRAFSAKETE